MFFVQAEGKAGSEPEGAGMVCGTGQAAVCVCVGVCVGVCVCVCVWVCDCCVHETNSYRHYLLYLSYVYINPYQSTRKGRWTWRGIILIVGCSHPKVARVLAVSLG